VFFSPPSDSVISTFCNENLAEYPSASLVGADTLSKLPPACEASLPSKRPALGVAPSKKFPPRVHNAVLRTLKFGKFRMCELFPFRRGLTIYDRACPPPMSHMVIFAKEYCSHETSKNLTPPSRFPSTMLLRRQGPFFFFPIILVFPRHNVTFHPKLVLKGFCLFFSVRYPHIFSLFNQSAPGRHAIS